MLILGRKKDDRIVIGGNIEVTVLEIRSDRVRLGISAPPEVTIHREELARRIRESCPAEAAGQPDSRALGAQTFDLDQ